MNRLLFNLIHFEREPNTSNVRVIIKDLARQLNVWADVDVIETYFQTPFLTNVRIRKIYSVEKQRALFRFKYLLKINKTTSKGRKKRHFLFVFRQLLNLLLQIYICRERLFNQKKD